MNRSFWESGMHAALAEAQKYVGATSPNPPVGAAALASDGSILAVAAHEKAGTPHAEAKLISKLKAENLLSQTACLVVTLEPCNHHGRTPPCSEAILATSIRTVVFGARDPNPRVAGGGAERLRQEGREVHGGILASECEALIRSFTHWSKTGRPWVIVKEARTQDGSMIPPPGQKTFTSPKSLRFAHELRRRADAILTASGTVLADSPFFTVRHVQDVPGKQRWLCVFDRQDRVPSRWKEEALRNGFRFPPAVALESLPTALDFLGKEGCLEALVEAGPTFTDFVLKSGLWQEHVVIQQQNPGEEDQIITRSNNVHGNR